MKDIKLNYKKMLTTIELIGGIYCAVCKGTYNNKKKYEDHYSVDHPDHCDNIQYSCLICHKDFQNYRRLRIHCYNHIQKMGFRCKIGLKQFSKQSALTKHENINLEMLTTIELIGGIYCAVCKGTYNNKKKYEDHYSVDHPDHCDNIQYSCLICHKDFQNYHRLRVHCYRIHIKKKYFECKICLEQFSKQSALTEHENIHLFLNYEKMLTTIELIGGIYCAVCKGTYNNKKKYEDHYSVDHPDHCDNIQYSCLICHKDFQHYPSLRGHCYTIHIIKMRFQCKICLKQFSKQSALTEHENLKHQFKCKPCNKDFPSDYELRIHLKAHKEPAGPPYPCKSCQEPISTFDECETHGNKHVITLHACPICNTTFEHTNTLCQHLKQHFNGETLESTEYDKEEDEMLIVCALCGQYIEGRKFLEQHIRDLHPGESVSYKCDTCGDQYNSFSCFSQHYKQHLGAETFKCNICPKVFSCKSYLLKHAAYCGSTRSRCRRGQLIHCPTAGCMYTFQKTIDLNVHRQAVHKDEKFCLTCGLEFHDITACAKHVSVHKKLKYVCPICDKHFKNKLILTKHSRVHFKTVYHICKSCNKVYHRKHRLVQHIKENHTRKFKCSYCPKEFTKNQSGTSYQEHLCTHTGQKPYKCVACHKEFFFKGNWEKHMKRIHSIDTKNVKRPMLKTELNIDNVPDDLLLEQSLSSDMVEQLATEDACPNILDDAYTFAVTLENENNIGLEEDMTQEEQGKNAAKKAKKKIDNELFEMLSSNIATAVVTKVPSKEVDLKVKKEKNCKSHHIKNEKDFTLKLSPETLNRSPSPPRLKDDVTNHLNKPNNAVEQDFSDADSSDRYTYKITLEESPDDYLQRLEDSEETNKQFRTTDSIIEDIKIKLSNEITKNITQQVKVKANISSDANATVHLPKNITNSVTDNVLPKITEYLNKQDGNKTSVTINIPLQVIVQAPTIVVIQNNSNEKCTIDDYSGLLQKSASSHIVPEPNQTAQTTPIYQEQSPEYLNDNVNQFTWLPPLHYNYNQVSDINYQPHPKISKTDANQHIFMDNLSTVSLDDYSANVLQPNMYNDKWEPPIITKVYENPYEYPLNDLNSIMSVMQTNIY